MDALLKINKLKVYFYTYQGIVKAVEDANLMINRREILGLVGETGCGKSVTARSILRIVPSPGKIVSGEIFFEGKNLLDLSEDEMRKIRGKEIAIIFQDPQSSLNPVYRVGEQIVDVMIQHEKLNKKEAWEKAIEMLRLVGISSPEQRIYNYPFELSGGMRQRIMIAMALACLPKLLIADEPTTNLDVTTQAQILQLIKSLQQNIGMSVLLITHDLGVVSEITDKTAVMYAGYVVEFSNTANILKEYAHPYVESLLKALPECNERGKRLYVIPGTLPNLLDPPSGCRFHPRCPYKKEICKKEVPKLIEIDSGHYVACHTPLRY